MELDVDLAKQTSADNLPNQAKDEMFTHFDDVLSANVHHRAADTLCGLNNNVVVLRHVESVQLLDLLARPIEHTFVNCVGNAVVYEFCKHQAILALVKHLKGVGWERKEMANIGITGEHGIDVTGEFGALVLVDCVRRARSRATDSDPATLTRFLSMSKAWRC